MLTRAKNVSGMIGSTSMVIFAHALPLQCQNCLKTKTLSKLDDFAMGSREMNPRPPPEMVTLPYVRKKQDRVNEPSLFELCIARFQQTFWCSY